MPNSRLDEQEMGSDSRFEALQEDLRNTNQRPEELQLRVPRPHLADVGIQEGKSGELEGTATEAGERRITPPEPQRQQPLLPSQSPRLPPQPPMMPQTSMSQPPPPPSQPPLLQYYLSPLHQSRHLPSSPFLAGRQQFHSTPSMIGTSNHRSPAGAGARGAVPAGESPAGIPWRLNPPVFSGDCVHFRSFEKEAIIFAEYIGFGHVLKDDREIPVADPSISHAQLRSHGYTDDKIDAHCRAYQFLRSAITSEVDRGILHRAHSPTEAWRSLKKWHNPDTVSASQTLLQRFLFYTMRPGQNPLVVLTALEEMAAQLSQQNFPMAPDQALLQFLTILPDSQHEVEKRTCSTGQRLNRDQVLPMIRTRYDNLQRQRKNGGGRREVGHAFVADAGSSGKPRGVVPREALEIMGEEKKVAKRRMAKRQTSMPATETSTARKEATQGAAVVVRPATKRCDDPDRCVAFAAEKAIRRKFKPTSSPFLPAKLTRAAATATGFSTKKIRTPSSVMHQARFSTSLVNGVQMRLHDR